MPKTHSQNAVVNNKGLARLATYCANHVPQLLWRATPNDDLGIDGSIELLDPNLQPLSKIIQVQLKSTEKDESYIRSDKGGKFTFSAEKSHVEYWVKLENDVLLIIYDNRNGANALYAKRIETSDLERAKGKSVTIHFDKSHDLLNENENDFIERFLESGKEAKRKTKFYPASFIPDLKYFVGREEFFANLNATLAAHHKASIHDISGLGKTFACYKYASDNQEKYSKIFFINAAKEAWMESLARLGQMLQPGIEDAPQEAQAMAFKNWLENNEGWLAIYDNVDEPALLKPFVPNNAKGDCLFTSNDSKIVNLGKHVSIDALPDKDAAILLFSRANSELNTAIAFPDNDEQSSFWQILKDIDGLPVAINAAGAFIADAGITFAEYLKRLESQPELTIDAEDAFDQYGKSTLAAFSLALNANTGMANQTEDGKLLAEAMKELYGAVSMIAPDDIHEEFLQGYLEENFEPFAEADNKEILWQDIRKKFRGFDLFKYDKNSYSFSTHRLIQKCIFSRLSDADKKSYVEKVLNLLFEEDFFPLYDYTNKEQCERYYQHTLAALENAERIGFEAAVSGGFYLRAARYQQLLGNYGQAEKFYKRSLEISRKVYGEEAAETATSLNNLAVVYRAQGKYDEAIGLYKQAIEIDEKTLGKEHTDYAASLNNLAGVYQTQGKYDEAIGLYSQAIEIAEKTIGKDHPDYAASLNNLAMVYYSQGKYDEAIRLYKEATEIDRRIYGEDHPDYAIDLNNLALVYYSQGKYDEAIGLYKQAMEIDRKIYGEDHPDYAIDLNNLALVYRNQEKYSEALPLFEEALRIFEAKLPPEHMYIAIAKEGIDICKERVTGDE